MHEHGPIEAERRDTGAEMIREAVESNKNRLHYIVGELQNERLSEDKEKLEWQEHEVTDLIAEAKMCMTRLKNLLGTYGTGERASEIFDEVLSKIEDPKLKERFIKGVEDGE